MECAICKELVKSQRVLIYHLKKYHQLDLETYNVQYKHIEEKNCIYCGNKCSFNQKTNTYREVCSNKKCIGKYAKSISDKSVMEKYGVSNVFALPDVIKKGRETKLERHGSETYNNMEQNKKTCLERYGVDNGSKSEGAKQKISDKYDNSNKEIRKLKTIKTNQNKYNVDWNSQSEIVKQNKKISYLKKWGVDHPMKSDEFQNNRKISFKEKYGYEYISQIPDVKQKISSSYFDKRKKRLLDKFGDIIIDFPDKMLVKIKCPICENESIINHAFMSQRSKFGVDLCMTCTPYKIESYIQNKLSEWIINLGINVVNNYKIPESLKEIDIFIPEKNIGFEFNGVYWHSEKFKDKDFHKNKKMLGIKNGINIINIWEDDFILNENLIKNKIKFLLNIDIKNIGARECEIREIQRNSAVSFLEKNHLQGFINSKVYIGLFYKNELVSLITFGRRNGLKQNEWEIFRFCNKSEYTINGAFNKLLTYFKNVYFPSKIITYIDLDWANYRNNIYEKNGFTFLQEVGPGYSYLIGKKRESRQKYQKHKLVEQGFDKNKTEGEIMNELGYLKVWNCGNLKYELNIKNETR